MFSASSVAEWTKLFETPGDAETYGTTHYVALDRIRTVNGFTYYWHIEDLLVPTVEGYMSFRSYNRVHCKSFQMMAFSSFSYQFPMAEGYAVATAINDEYEVTFPPHDTVLQTVLEAVCNH